MNKVNENSQGRDATGDEDLLKKLQVFRNLLEIAWSFYLDVENDIEMRWSDQFRAVSDNAKDLSSELRQQLSDMAAMYHELLRQGRFIQVCSLMEYTLRVISRTFVSDYEKRMPGGRGNWRQHLSLLRETVDIELCDDDISVFQDLWTLRNCVAHAAGHIEEYDNPAKIREIISKFQKRGKEENVELVGEKENGYLLLGTDFIPEVFVRGDNILEPVFDAICSRGIERKQTKQME